MLICNSLCKGINLYPSLHYYLSIKLNNVNNIQWDQFQNETIQEKLTFPPLSCWDAKKGNLVQSSRLGIIGLQKKQDDTNVSFTGEDENEAQVQILVS